MKRICQYWEQIWDRFMGATGPQEFSGDEAALNEQIESYLDDVYNERTPIFGVVPQEDRDEIHRALVGHILLSAGVPFIPVAEARGLRGQGF